MFDITLHDAVLAENPSERVDIAVVGGRIAAIGPGLESGRTAHHLGGRLVVPGFCETHVHLDKACILDRCTMTGGIADAITEVGTLKASFTAEDVAQRAGRTLQKCVVNGTNRMRTHVEVDPTIGLRGIEGVKAAIKAWSFAIDVEICVFPQDGLLNNPGTDALMVAALNDGARVVGAAPYVDTDPFGQIDRVFEMAREFDVDIDMHLDFGVDPEGLHVEHVMARTLEHGWGGRVAVGHVTRFAALGATRLKALSRRLGEAGVAVTVLPATDLYLMHRGRTDVPDPPRGVTQLHTMAAEGVTGSISTNNVLNPFTPYGDGSLIRMANLYANIAQLGRPDDLAGCFEMITSQPAKLMRREDHGITPGGRADLVVIDSDSPAMAIAEIAQPLMGFFAGRQTFARAAPTVFHPD